MLCAPAFGSLLLSCLPRSYPATANGRGLKTNCVCANTSETRIIIISGHCWRHAVACRGRGLASSPNAGRAWCCAVLKKEAVRRAMARDQLLAPATARRISPLASTVAAILAAAAHESSLSLSSRCRLSTEPSSPLADSATARSIPCARPRLAHVTHNPTLRAFWPLTRHLSMHVDMMSSLGSCVQSSLINYAYQM